MISRLKNFDQLFHTVRKKTADILKDGEACHDFDHTLRVLKNTCMLAEEENISPAEYEAVRLAALLHDCARPEEFASGGKICHAVLGAEKAARILHELGCFEDDLIRSVSDAIARHRFRSNMLPVTLVDRILYDADKLDSIGAIGVGRAFHFAGRLGARVHNTAEDALNSESYRRNDTAYREYLVKLRHIPEKLTTEAGRRHAAGRIRVMEAFFKELQSETGIS